MQIDIIIHTPGGLVLSAEQIAMALKRHKAKHRGRSGNKITKATYCEQNFFLYADR